ncbi:MAG TPA: hypothetical protein VFN91_07155 [Myxococcaceae bacterium]|nr:hypothetical protein [Myxococcaceae bacterium]
MLVELLTIDTAYADLYLRRACQLAAAELSPVDYRALKLADEGVHSLPGQIQQAIDVGKWSEVRALAEEFEAKKRLLEDRGPLRSLGEKLHETHEIHVDPFSPGFHWFQRRDQRELGPLRDASVAKFGQAARLDPDWRRLYQEREEALRSLRLGEGSAPTKSLDLEQQARDALASGSFAALQKIAARIETTGVAPTASSSEQSSEQMGSDLDATPLTVTFDTETLQKARALGLEAEHLEDVRERFRSLLPYLWRPVFFESDSGPAARVRAMLPRDTPDALRDRIVMLVTRPILTSGGARFVPPLVEEDVLVESFEEGPAGAPVGKNGLAEALGLESRWGLSRRKLERVLQSRGPGIVESLGLDPWKFRLVSVPPDVFGVLGERRGWGKNEIWTHLDGYLATRERKLLALAGGDVRYGGVQDLVGVGVGYDSDRLLARFAIVHRRRLRAW